MTGACYGIQCLDENSSTARSRRNKSVRKLWSGYRLHCSTYSSYCLSLLATSWIYSVWSSSIVVLGLERIERVKACGILWTNLVNEPIHLVNFSNSYRVMILCSILLFVLSGRRILHVRAKVNEAQIKEDVEQPGRKSSIPKLRRFSWSKPTDSDLEPISNTSSSVPPDVDVPEVHHHEIGHELTPPDRTGSARSSAPEFQRPSIDSSTAFAAHAHRRRSTRFEAMHWKYAKFAFLCTLVLFITWIPISVNRIYNNFIRPDHPSFGLYFASALCIPLHGFGNFIIYVNTSWAEVKQWVIGLLPKKFRVPRRSSEAGGDCTSQTN